MAEPCEVDVDMEDDYDESEDSDFHADNADDVISSSSEDEARTLEGSSRPVKRRKLSESKQKDVLIEELDSGDEATIKEQEKVGKKQRGKGVEALHEDEQEQGWRARTRAMRERDKEEQKRSKLASAKGSTIDVDKIWEEMNKPGSYDDARPRIEVIEEVGAANASERETPGRLDVKMDDVGQENRAPDDAEDLITIKVKYKFAGEIHVQEKTVPRSSEEAQRYLSTHTADDHLDGERLRKPLRKISRFDPNFNNLDAYKVKWIKEGGDVGGFKGPKLNTVEKSKMDWKTHVEKEGLKDELDLSAKARGGYIANQQFLGQVEQRQDDEVKNARRRI